MGKGRRDPDALLPLTTGMFQVLIALADRREARLRNHQRGGATSVLPFDLRSGHGRVATPGAD